MIKTVIKRDGRIKEFDGSRIFKAVKAAFRETDIPSNVASDCASSIANEIKGIGKEQVEIEWIQDQVIFLLRQKGFKKVADAYEKYRDQRTTVRNKHSDFTKRVAEKLTASNVQNQNANVDEHSFGGRLGEAANELTTDYALNYLLSPMARKNHIENTVYEHDLSAWPLGDHNCLTMPIDKLLANGFNTRQTDVRPAQSVNTAFQLVAVLFQLQSLNQFGGVSASHIDWTMVTYVRKSFMKHYVIAALKDDDAFYNADFFALLADTYEDKTGIYRSRFDDWLDDYKDTFLKQNNLKEEDFRFDNEKGLKKRYYRSALFDTIQETYQAVEGMFHNLNTLQSRSGNQLPFTSINYGTCTLPEGRLVTRAILDISIKGIGKQHKTSVFPCHIFQCMKGVNRKFGEPNYDLYKLALKSTAKRLYPNYANVDWSNNKGYDKANPATYFSTMGCRTANLWDMNGFGQLKDGRGNICPVTIIMPSLAMEVPGGVYHKDVEAFMKLLDQKIHEAKQMLIERYNYICSQDPASGKFMYENGTMAGYVPEEGIRSALKHGTLAIGQLGLAETLQILIGTDQCTDEGMKLAKRIEQLFKDRCSEFKHELHKDPDGYEYYLNFGVYFTPAENLCFTAMKKFKKKYGVIKNVSENDFFTNSEHVPVWKHVSPFEKIDIESQLTGYSSAGCITYVELDSSAQNNLDAVEAIVNYAMDKDIPYFAINVPNDQCMECGYIGDMNDTCPHCGSDHIRRLRRVTGYLTGDYTTAFNLGKQDEVHKRFKNSQMLDPSVWKE